MNDITFDVGKLIEELFEDKYKQTCFMQIKCKCFPQNPNGKDEIIEIILDFANEQNKDICDVRVADFNSSKSNIPFFKYYILMFKCTTHVQTSLQKWFNNKYKFKKFTYKDVDYEVLDMLWFHNKNE
jgi:hypothetical protein